MSKNPLRILLITNIQGSFDRTNKILKQTDLGKFHLESANADLGVLGSFAQNHFDICIVDCFREGSGLIAEARRLGFAGPIIIFTANSATEVLDAIHNGASDCVVRDIITAPLLERSICAAIDRAHATNLQAQYERCYLGLMENARDVIFTQDLEGNYISINKAGEHLTGYIAEEVLKMNFRQLIAPEYLPSVAGALSRMLADRRPTRFEVVFVTKDQTRVRVKVSVHLIYKEGTPVGVQGIAKQAWLLPSAYVADEDRAKSA